MPTMVPDRSNDPKRKMSYLENVEEVKRKERISPWQYEEMIKARKPGTKDPFYDYKKRIGEWDPERY
jgi:hypothetical protein